MYEPAFFEVFLAFLGVLAWSWWLRGKPGCPAFVAPVMSMVTAIVMGAVAVGLIIAAGTAAGEGASFSTVLPVTRWIAVSTVGIGAAVCGVASVRILTADRASRGSTSQTARSDLDSEPDAPEE